MQWQTALGFKLEGFRHPLFRVGFRIDESYLSFVITYTGTHLHINMYKISFRWKPSDNIFSFYHECVKLHRICRKEFFKQNLIKI